MIYISVPILSTMRIISVWEGGSGHIWCCTTCYMVGDDWLDGTQVDDDDLIADWQLHGNETNRAVGSVIRDALR